MKSHLLKSRSLNLRTIFSLFLLWNFSTAALADDLRGDSGCLSRAPSAAILAELGMRLAGWGGGGSGGGYAANMTYYCQSSRLVFQHLDARGVVTNESFDLNFSSDCRTYEDLLTRKFSRVREPVRVVFCISSRLQQVLVSAEGMRKLPPIDFNFSSDCRAKAQEMMGG
jgi:hypothetical protein